MRCAVRIHRSDTVMVAGLKGGIELGFDRRPLCIDVHGVLSFYASTNSYGLRNRTRAPIFSKIRNSP